MTAFLSAAAVAFAVVFVAEIGDKSQLMALTFATRFRALPVIIGISVAAALTHGLSVGVGYLLGAALPTFWITLVAALVFVAFGVWTLREDALPDPGDDEDSGADRRASGLGAVSRSAVLAVGTAFFLAELGDKTMIASVTLAAQNPSVAGVLGVWLGATAGMVTVGIMAVVVGRALGRRLPERVIRLGSAILFFAFGIWLGVEAVMSA